MQSQTRESLTDNAVARLAGRFGLLADGLTPIQAHRNLVFKGFNASGKAVALKLVRTGLRGRAAVIGELDWMMFLHSKGVPVPRPNVSVDGELVETYCVGDVALHAYCVDWIAGTLWRDSRADMDVRAIGSLAGRMAAVSDRYMPCSPEAHRPSWRDAPWFRDPHMAIHRSMPKVIGRVIALRDALDALPREAFGPVHDDLHSGNIILTDSGPVPIDFENSHYTWHVAEIASALFFHLWKTQRSVPAELSARASTFTAAFLEAYRREHALPAYWIRQIPAFLKLRELSIFASCGLQDKDFDTVGSSDERFVFMKANIEEAVPYVDLDFDQFA